MYGRVCVWGGVHLGNDPWKEKWSKDYENLSIQYKEFKLNKGGWELFEQDIWTLKLGRGWHFWNNSLAGEKQDRDISEEALAIRGWRSVVELGIEHKFEGSDRTCKTNRIRGMKEIIKMIASTIEKLHHTAACSGIYMHSLWTPQNIPI